MPTTVRCVGDGAGCTEVRITATDGEFLAGTLYLPDPAQHPTPWAAVLEALPYRKDDITESYRATYQRYAAAGLAVLRLDLRGTGSSSGIATDEYPDVERTDLRSAIEWLAGRGIRSVATIPGARLAIWDADLTGAVALVVGSEQYGLSPTWRQQADLEVGLPMAGSADSLNAAMAAGIALFEAVRQRR